MTARVLVVDDIEANVKLLKARLMAEYFEVLTASNGPDALEICLRGECDIVLLDVMMPGMDGFEVCRRLKANPVTMHLPVVMVTALDQASDRLAGLEAGADDFLTKPVADIALTTRVKSLARMKMATDELKLRLTTGRELGIEELSRAVGDDRNGKEGRVLIVDDRTTAADGLAAKIAREQEVTVTGDASDALYRASAGDFDLVIVSMAIESFDALRLCSQLRSLEQTRLLPILVVTTEGDHARLLRALDIGVNDYVARPIEANEFRARVRAQVRRHRLDNQLRDNLNATMEAAVKDGLTGLNNRRYFDRHVAALHEEAVAAGKQLALIVLDIDHFKLVNDTYGHQAGDEVLRIFAERISKNVRGRDLACRFGGEEFVVIMPSTDIQLAHVVADRMRREVAANPIRIDNGEQQIGVTVSAGIACLKDENDTVEAMLKRADDALYAAKKAGRNQVISAAA